jgi:hypothetical protein
MGSLIDGYRFRQILEETDSRRQRIQDIDMGSTSMSLLVDDIIPRFRWLLRLESLMDIQIRRALQSPNIKIDSMTDTIMKRLRIWVYQELFLLRQELWICMVFKDIKERLEWYSSREKAIWLKCWCWEGMDPRLADLMYDVIGRKRLLPTPARKAIGK